MMMLALGLNGTDHRLTLHQYLSHNICRELRHKKLVDDSLARHGLKRKAMNEHRLERLREAAEGEAEELLDAQVRSSIMCMNDCNLQHTARCRTVRPQ